MVLLQSAEAPMKQIHIRNVRDFTGPMLVGISIYLGRPSALGNPFIVGRDGGHAMILRLYREWFLEQMQEVDSPAASLFYTLYDIGARFDLTLLCWCRPHHCHVDIVAKYLKRYTKDPDCFRQLRR